MGVRPAPKEVRKVPTYCYQCVAGPDLLTVKVVDGVATEVEPNFEVYKVTPSNGKVCVKACGLIQKLYNPNRVLTPMKRTNLRKGRDEDPGFVPVSWDEALDTIAERLKSIRAEGPTDPSGYPRIAASFGGGGTPTYYMGTLPAFLASLGPIDFGFGSGQGVKCYHSEHLYGELWHRAFTVAPDTPNCDDAACRAASAEITDGAEFQGLDWYRENAVRVSESPRVKWYLYAALEDQDLRFELPYQERLMRVGRQLGRRLHEQGISWWDTRLDEYEPLAALDVLKRAAPSFAFPGTALPLALSLGALLVPAYSTLLAAAGGAFAAAGGWYLKWIIVTRAAYNQGFALEHTAARGGGRPGAGTKPGW